MFLFKKKENFFVMSVASQVLLCKQQSISDYQTYEALAPMVFPSPENQTLSALNL
jgi:hypothetical protein